MALSLLHKWRAALDTELLRRGLLILGLESLASAIDIPEIVAELNLLRINARMARDFELSDRLRDAIAAEGFEVRDGPGGPVLFPKSGR